jgi:membrane protein required for colicin V production
MNWLDILLLLIAGLSLAASFRKGLAREVIGLLSVVLALLLGLWFYGTAGSFLAPHIESRQTANMAGFVLVFTGVLLAGVLVNYLVGKFLKATGLSFFDHLLGALFGLARGFLLCVALIFAMMAFSQAARPPEAVVGSRLAPYVLHGARVAAAMAPHEIKESFRKRYAQARGVWARALERGAAIGPAADKQGRQ